MVRATSWALRTSCASAARPSMSMGRSAGPRKIWSTGSAWADLRAANVCVIPEDQALDATAAIDTTMITLKKAATTANPTSSSASQASTPTRSPWPLPARCGWPGWRSPPQPSQFWSLNPKSQLLADGVDWHQPSSTISVPRRCAYVRHPVRQEGAGRHRADARSAELIALNFVSNLGDLLGALPVPPTAAGEVNTS